MKTTLMAAMVLALCATAQAQETIQLPTPDRSKATMSLTEALAKRHSVRSFSDRALTNEQLSLLLWSAAGVNREDGRLTAPSAMNRQDVEIYVCRADGAYRYDGKANKLTRVSKQDLRAAAADRQAFAKDAPVNLILVSDQRKFGNNPNHDYGCVDVGYVSQNIYLAATAMGLGTVARGTMNREQLVKGLGLVEQQLLLLNHPVGYAK